MMSTHDVRRLLWSGLKACTPSTLYPINVLARRIQNKTGMRIQSGPFRGMRYIATSFGSAHNPKLIGMYEKELHGVIHEICERNPTVIIDIGAAEGYYAVGFAMRLPDSRIIAYDADADAKNLMAQLAKANHVEDHIEIRGECVADSLESDLSDESVVLVVDVEGAEISLLDPSSNQYLKKIAILVEAHYPEGTREWNRFRCRFSSTHIVKWIPVVSRNRTDYPFSNWYSALLSDRQFSRAVGEGRSASSGWFWMTPK